MLHKRTLVLCVKAVVSQPWLKLPLAELDLGIPNLQSFLLITPFYLKLSRGCERPLQRDHCFLIESKGPSLQHAGREQAFKLRLWLISKEIYIIVFRA